MTINYKGADCNIQFLGDNTSAKVYIHFGSYEDFDEDEDYIFYFCDSESDLKSLMKKGVEDFVILDYELIEWYFIRLDIFEPYGIIILWWSNYKVEIPFL